MNLTLTASNISGISLKLVCQFICNNKAVYFKCQLHHYFFYFMIDQSLGFTKWRLWLLLLIVNSIFQNTSFLKLRIVFSLAPPSFPIKPDVEWKIPVREITRVTVVFFASLGVSLQNYEAEFVWMRT